MFTYEGVARLLATRSSVLPAWYGTSLRGCFAALCLAAR